MREREGICFGGIFKLIFPEDEKTFAFQKFYKTGVCIKRFKKWKGALKVQQGFGYFVFF